MSAGTVRRFKLSLLPALLLAAGMGCNYRLVNTSKTPTFDTEYQVVVLVNGQVLIGKIEGLETAHPILRDVYSLRIMPAGDPQNPSKTTNVIVSRSKEWHSPAFTVLNSATILAVEPVSKGSQMDELIAQEKRGAVSGK